MQTMKPHRLLLLILSLSLSARADDAPVDPNAALKKALADAASLVAAQQTLVDARKGLQDSQNSLADAKNKQLTDAITSLAAITKPTNAYTISEDGKGTPASALLTAGLLEQVADKVAANIMGKLGERPDLILGETAPASSAQLVSFRDTVRRLQADGDRLLQELKNRKLQPDAALADTGLFDPIGEVLADKEISSTPPRPGFAPTLIAAIPALVGQIAGFFNVETTENVFTETITDDNLNAAVLQALLAKRKDPFLAVPAFRIWASREAYVLSLVGSDLSGDDSISRLEALGKREGQLAYVLAFAEPGQAKAEATKKQNEDSLKEITTKLDALSAEDKADKPLAATATADEREAQQTRKTARLAAVAKLQADQTALHDIKAPLDVLRLQTLTSLVKRLQLYLAGVGEFAKTLSVKDGSLPLLLGIVAEDRLAKIPANEVPAQFNCTVILSRSSSVTRKRWLWNSYYANATLSVRYSLTTIKGEVLDTGVVHQGAARKIPGPGSLEPMTWEK